MKILNSVAANVIFHFFELILYAIIYAKIKTFTLHSLLFLCTHIKRNSFHPLLVSTRRSFPLDAHFH